MKRRKSRSKETEQKKEQAVAAAEKAVEQPGKEAAAAPAQAKEPLILEKAEVRDGPEKILESHDFEVDSVPVHTEILIKPDEYVPIYKLVSPEIEPATDAVLDKVREKMIEETILPLGEVISPDEIQSIKNKFFLRAFSLIRQELPHLSIKKQRALSGILMYKSLGLGTIEILLQDKNIEEIAINCSKEPLWCYHIKYGWLKSNIFLPSETAIYNYSSLIGRRVGTQITNLNPLMDAYMSSGDRANATLFPISSRGNTLTIRKFARRPWTITDFIKQRTLSLDIASFLWLAIQYELNVVVAGGTASGKTSLLNCLTLFIPPNHRIISIEETRELQLPDFMHWVPLTTRPPNPEGKGEVSMLDLMINSLRMRPDRVLVGEIRRSREAEVLFEAIHTGHSVYSTLHANTAEETMRRLLNPPINIPISMLASLQLITVMHRDRRKGVRRVLEISELIPSGGTENIRMELNTLFRWIASKDEIMQWGKSHRALNDIKLFTGMDEEELERDLKEKRKILEWMVKNDVNDINKVGRIISDYYVDKEGMMKRLKI